jgi:cyclopropane-fatty-acyl-phospholipid synthase
MNVIHWAERGWVPDWMIRIAIRELLRRRLIAQSESVPEQNARNHQRLMRELAEAPIAIDTDAANEQHYEVPAAFFKAVLGPHLKYSSGLWSDTTSTLAESEAAMLEATCEFAGLANDQDVLELGCGWGSLSLWMAERYPDSRITSVSNSNSQREFIEQQAAERGLPNLRVITCDVNALSLDTNAFDRVVSVEMFEHVRNYAQLMQRISQWLRPDGALFVHHFCHRFLAYPFVAAGHGDWMARYFFTGGLMPSADTLLHFQQDLVIDARHLYSGRHYGRTLRAWLDQMDASRAEVMPILTQTYGDDAALWWQRWRMFFMACEELFNYQGGNAWLVGHYRFVPRRGSSTLRSV